MASQSIGILYFTRSINKEARSKVWHNNFDVNYNIARHLIHSTRKKLIATGYKIIEIDEHLQKGTSIGEKISNAFQYGFQLGFEQLIMVGNDCTALTHREINCAIEQLNNKGFTSGKTNKGGLYLIGANSSIFQKNKTIFENLPWQTNELANAFKRLETRTNHSRIDEKMPVFHDLNNALDLQSVLNTKCKDILKTIVYCSLFNYLGTQGKKLYFFDAVCNFLKRGPPKLIPIVFIK